MAPSDKSRPATRFPQRKKTTVHGAVARAEAPQGPTVHAEVQALAKRCAELELRAAVLDEQLKKAREDLVRSEVAAAMAERRAQEAASRTSPVEQEAAALRPQLDEARRRLKEAQADLKRVREERDRAKETGAQAEAHASALQKREQEVLAQLAKMTALKLEASSFHLRMDQARADLKKAQDELRGRADAAAKADAAAGAAERARRDLDETRAKLEEARAKLLKAQETIRAQADAATKAADAARAEMEEAQRKMGQLSEEILRLREARDRAESDNIQHRAEAADLRDKLLQLELKAAEARTRVESMTRELGEATSAAATARQEAAKAGEVADHLKADTVRLEGLRAQQDKTIDLLSRKVADLERRLAESSARKPEPVPAPPPPPPPAPAPAPVEIEVEKPAPPPPPAAAEPIPPPQAVPASASPETTLRPQNTFGPAGDDGQPKYMLHEVLSKNPLGVVYAVSERATGRKLMVQFMSGQAGEEQTQAIERVMEKLVALPHPNLLHVQGTGRRKNRLYVMTDLVEAPTLGQAKIQEIPRLVAILRDAASAVHYAHEEGIFHGGISPETILVARDNDKDVALVKEFGLGFLQEIAAPAAPGKDTPPVFRDPAYLPPEQIRTLKSSLVAAVDVYGLGATLYGVLAGRPPFEGKDANQIAKRVMMQEPQPVEVIRRDVPKAVGAVVRRAMAKERGLRYATAQEMADALTRCLETAP